MKKLGILSFLCCMALGACTSATSNDGGLTSKFEGSLPIDGVITFQK